MEFSPFRPSLTVDCETGEQSTLTVFVCHLQSSIFKCMKRSRRPAKPNRRGAGWTGDTYQESDSDNGPESRHRPKDPHPHVIVSATPAGTQSSVVNAFTHPAALPKPTFEFVDPPPSNDNDAQVNYEDFEMLDSFFQEYGLMDPELSAAWDEDHGLKAKRTRTASVSRLMSLLMDPQAKQFYVGQPNAPVEGSQPRAGIGRDAVARGAGFVRRFAMRRVFRPPSSLSLHRLLWRPIVLSRVYRVDALALPISYH